MNILKQIKVLSILFYLNAALAILVGGLSIYSALDSAAAKGGNPAYISARVSPITADLGLNIFLTTLAIILLLVLGLGLARLKPWARTITLAYGTLTILVSLINLFLGDHNFSYHFFVQVYAVWVLTRPSAKAAFNV